MFCKNTWNTEFLQTNMRSGFMNKAYKNHTKTVIFDRERALFPETQMDIEQDKRNKEIDEKIKQKKLEIQRIKEEIYALEMEKKGEKKEKKQVVQYSIPCTQPNCRGFLNHKSVCGICDKQHCSKCRVATDNLDEHKCDANTLETLKMLEKDTKPCPKCFTPIFKIAGCFAENTEILLYNGTIKKSQDIKVGDILVGDDGLPREVLELCSGVDKLYKVSQNNGIDYTVNSKHSLVLKKKEEIVHIIVEDYLKLLDKQLLGYKSNGETSVIKVSYKETGKYYGWKVNENTRFVLPDLTVVKNCDQMWCTQCKTPFSWKTGMIETGNIHNPHYWQYLQKEGRDLDQVREMNGLRRANNCENVVQTMAYDFLTDRKYSEVCRLLLHIQGVDVRKYITQNYIEENRELRKEFLTGKIDETKFKKTLQMRQKKQEFKDEVRQLLVMFHDVGRDTLKKLHTKFIETKKKWNEQNESVKKQVDEELTNLTIYTEDQLKKICDRYDYVTPNIVLGTINRMKLTIKPVEKKPAKTAVKE